jgi:dTDP-4-dehydrorhamnose reductase
VNILRLKNKINLVQVTSEYYSKEYFAIRPPSERLTNKKLELRGLNIMRDWKVALKEYIENYFNDLIVR